MPPCTLIVKFISVTPQKDSPLGTGISFQEIFLRWINKETNSRANREKIWISKIPRRRFFRDGKRTICEICR